MTSSVALSRQHVRLVNDFDFPNFWVLYIELIIISNDLHLIRHLVAADFISFVQIDFWALSRGLESPDAANIVGGASCFGALYGLVSFWTPEKQRDY
jgi:hypothetical protein